MAGKYFEEFVVGQVFKHQPGRTITETDNQRQELVARVRRAGLMRKKPV